MELRQIILLTSGMLFLALAILYSLPQPTQSTTVITGNITVVDSKGAPLPVIITSHGQSERSPTVKWIAYAPYITIKLDAIETKGVSAEFQINSNSPTATVVLENYNSNPETTPPPGTPIKYVNVSAYGLSYRIVEINIHYTDAELSGQDENRLVIYHYKNGTWCKLNTSVDTVNNILSTTVNTLSTFAVVAPLPEWNISVVDSTDSRINSTIDIYENGKLVRLYTSTSGLNTRKTTSHFVSMIASKIDVSSAKNTSLSLKNASVRGSGKIILDDYGKNNPAPATPPGKPVKYVEIGVDSITYSSAEITIQYSDAELEGADENSLRIYHWNGEAWKPLATTVDPASNTLTATTASLSPFAVTYQDKWKLVFDSSFDDTFKPPGIWNPKVWLYNQNESLVANATVKVDVWVVNDNNNQIVTSQNATDNGDGSYNYSFDASAYSGKYLRVKFSTQQNLTTIEEERSIYAGNSDPAKGIPWKIVWLNTSAGPVFKYTAPHNIFVFLYNDGDRPSTNPNHKLYLTATFANGTSVITDALMNNNGDGTYNYTIPANTFSNEDDVIFKIKINWGLYPITGGQNRNQPYETEAVSDKFMEANATDHNPPSLWDIEQNPIFPTSQDNLTIRAKAADNVGVTGVYVVYKVNNGSLTEKQMTYESGYLYTADLGKFNREDKIEYYISARDAEGNTEDSSTYEITIGPAAGEPVTAWGYLNRNVFWFGKSRQASLGDDDGDGVLYVYKNEPDTAAHVQEFVDFCTIKVFTYVLDGRGRPVSDLDVYAWLSNNTNQSIDTQNLKKKMNETGHGKYYTEWRGAPYTNLTPAGDSADIWGKYLSGNTYYVYIDFDNDSIPDTSIPWIAYTVGDTFWNSPADGKGAAHVESLNCDTPKCHDMADAGGRASGEPTCSDCHGVTKNIGALPYTGTNDTILYLNSTSHPSPGNINTSINCSVPACHDQFNNGEAYVDYDPPVPGYPDGTYNITNDYYPNPSQCAECHTYKDNVIPTTEGHNRVIECKYCHGSYHAQNNLTTFTPYDNNNTQTVTDDTNSNGTPGFNYTYAGNCYDDCHKTQEKHAGVVACDECHAGFNTAPFHQEDLSPVEPKDTCGGCHHNSSYSYNGITPPQQPVLHHTTETDGIWSASLGYDGQYWAEEESSCRYCHGRTYNDENALGRVRLFNGTNIVNSSIGVSTWCASCHYKGYQSGSKNYTDMVNAYNTTMGMVPPEITNGTYAPTSDPNFFNHLNISEMNLTKPDEDYSDAQCKRCHGELLSENATINDFIHDTEKGGGRADCKSCHNMSATEIPKINWTSFNKTLHSNINSNANTSGVDPSNAACWACHGNGSRPEKHPPGYKTPKKCEDCHTDSNTTRLFNAPLIVEHTPNSPDVTVRQEWYCTNCHNNSIDTDHNDTGINPLTGKNETWLNATVAHYENNITLKTLETPEGTTDCLQCHYNDTNAALWGNATNIVNITEREHPERTVEECYACHSETGTAPTTLHAAEVYSPKDIPSYRAKVYIIKTRQYDARDAASDVTTYYSGPSATFMVDPAGWLDSYYFDILDDSTVDYWWYPKAQIRVLLLDSDGNKISNHTLKMTIKDPEGNIIRNGAYHWNNTAGKPLDGTAGDPDVNEDGIFLDNITMNNIGGGIYNYTIQIDRDIPDASFGNYSGTGKYTVEIYDSNASSILSGTGYFYIQYWGCDSCHEQQNFRMSGKPCHYCHSQAPPSSEGGPVDHFSWLVHRTTEGAQAYHPTGANGASDCTKCHKNYVHGSHSNVVNSCVNTTCHGAITPADGNSQGGIENNWNPKCGNCHKNSSIEGVDVTNLYYGLEDNYGEWWSNTTRIAAVRDNTSAIYNGPGSPIKTHAHPDNSAKVECGFCHDAFHAIGKPSKSAGINGNCWQCHDASDGAINGISKNMNCKNCHINTESKVDAHHPAKVGGPDCVLCHDLGGSAPYHVNITVMNSSDAIHKNINNNATTSLDFNNKRCWACHGNGSEPSGHPTNYKTPYNCTDCHVAGGNSNFTPNDTILLVDEHFWNGSNITTSEIISCYACHNLSEMMLAPADPWYCIRWSPWWQWEFITLWKEEHVPCRSG
jgi:hypothetical protein